MGQLYHALEKNEQSLQMRRAIHRHSKSHPEIATSLNNLGLVYREMGNLDKALDAHKQSLKIEQAIHGLDKPHPAIASSLNNFGLMLKRICRG